MPFGGKPILIVSMIFFSIITRIRAKLAEFVLYPLAIFSFFYFVGFLMPVIWPILYFATLI